MINPNRTAGDANTAYDGGTPRALQTVVGGPALNATGSTVIPAAAGLKSKVVGLVVYTSAWTTEGTAALKDGAGGTTIFNIARFTAHGQRATFDIGGQVIVSTSVNTLLELFYTGNAVLQFSIVYYQAP